MATEQPRIPEIELNTLADVYDRFKTDEACLKYLRKIRFQNGYTCPHCLSTQSGMPDKIDDQYRCKKQGCGKKFSILKGTIFENTKTGMRDWFSAIYLVVSRTYGISSTQLSRDLGITQKSGWFLLHRIRETFSIYYPKMTGKITVEADETFLGGKARNVPKSKKKDRTQGRSLVNKAVVFGVLERGGLLRAKVVPNTKGETLEKVMLEWVEEGATLMTDEWQGYNWAKKYFNHHKVKHKERKMAYSDVHLNGIEGAWANLKRRWAMMHYIDRKYLQRLVDEFVWAYNHRYMSVNNKFHLVLEMACTKRISYKELQESLPPMTNRESEYLLKIQHAIDNESILEISYINEQKIVTKRRVEPIGLAIYNGQWHMIAWCHLRNDYRDFKVLRIEKIRNTVKPFVYSDHMPIKIYVRNNRLDYEIREFRDDNTIGNLAA